MGSFHVTRYLKSVFQTPSDACYWFGYYNYDPLNIDQSKVLCNRSQFDAVAIEKGMEIDLGFFDMSDGEWHKIGSTDAFNWQQGAMMQWIPAKERETRIIYNCSKDNHLISRIHDINTGKNRDLHYPIYGITPDGKKSISLNMERAYWCRAYHYQAVANPQYDVAVADDDGIYEIDLEKDTCKRIISIQDIINIDREPSFAKARHWLEHVMISPTGKRFCFLHRFSYGNIYNYVTRLFVADIDGSNLQIIDGWRTCRWSHFGWADDDSFVIYTYLAPLTLPGEASAPPSHRVSHSFAQPFKNTIKRIYQGLLSDETRTRINKLRHKKTQFYQYYRCESGKYVKQEEWILPEFSIDGHPSFTSDQRYMVTDTYPDWRDMQHLYFFDRYTHKVLDSGTFRDALTGRPGSCDLHPKLCRDGKHVIVDTAFDGHHHLLMFEIDWESIKKKLKK